MKLQINNTRQARFENLEAGQIVTTEVGTYLVVYECNLTDKCLVDLQQYAIYNPYEEDLFEVIGELEISET